LPHFVKPSLEFCSDNSRVVPFVELPFYNTVVLDSYQKILNYARTTQTQTGLRVTAYLDRRHYPCGLKPTPDQIASLRLQRHETLPEWNYTIKPQL
jgi:hypothetical protein